MRKTTDENIMEHYFGICQNMYDTHSMCCRYSHSDGYTTYVSDGVTKYNASNAITGNANNASKQFSDAILKDGNKPAVNRNYKDTVFRMLFSDKQKLLSLYNALNGTNHTNPDELVITTIENAIYMSVKNDISCLIDMRLDMYEHQSTVNPNMPLRDLGYVAKVMSNLTSERDMYSSKLIELPNPEFIVFYNGTKEQPAIREYRLSDAYVHKDRPLKLELIVTQININSGYNDKLLESCKDLKEYMQYVDRVRTHSREMSLKDAVKLAVEECIKENILKEFLLKNKAEVMGMSLFEYDAELHERTLFEEGREEGFTEGIKATVSILKENNFSFQKITETIMNKFTLSYDEAMKYM